MKKIAFFIFIVFLGIIYPQDQKNSITGFITDKTTGLPLPDVNIFISGTNIGIVSAQNGYYEIMNMPKGKQKLTFSLIGYETVSADFNITPSSELKYDVELLPRIYSTETVEIRSERPMDRNALLNTFRGLFLGEQENANDCRIEGESKIQITKLSSDAVRFSSDSSITIINNALGYRLDGPLVNFKLNTNTKEYSSYFEPVFTELVPKDSAVAQRWAENRKMAFRGSLRHFLKSLYHGTASKEGFQVYILSPDIEDSKPQELKDLSSLTSEKNYDEKRLFFRDELIVKYGLDVSALKLNHPVATLDRNGKVKERSPFEVYGSFATSGVSKMLPEDYDPDRFKIRKKNSTEPDQHEMMSAFLDSISGYKGKRYEALKDSLLKLTFRYPANSMFKLKYAAVLERCCIVSAENEYREAAEKDTSCGEAFFRLGEIQAEDFNEYRTSVKKMDVPSYVYETLYGSENPDPSTMLGSLKNVSTEMFKEAEASLRKALALNPAPEDYYLTLVFLYEDNGDYPSAIDIMKALLKRNPDNKDAHLYLGMLYFKTSSYKNSRDQYDEALSLMSADEKNDFMFTSAKMLVEPAVSKGFDKLDDITLTHVIKRFWQSEDPMILTGYNERLLEHYSRVAYANLRFANKKRSVPGWKSERGEILVRYGFPKSVVRYRPFVEFEYRLTTYAKTEVWYYGDMTFSFSDRFLTGDYPLNVPLSPYVKSQYESDSRDFADRLKKEMFERYTFKPEGQSIAGAFRTYQFKNFSERSARKTDLYMSLLIPEMPAKKDTSSSKDGTRDISAVDYISAVNNNSFKYGLYCFDSRYNMISGMSDSLINFKGENIISTPGKGTAGVIVNNISGYPGDLNMAGEILRSSDNSAFSSHVRIKAKDFSSDSKLMISDIVISPKAVFGTGSQSAINRSGIWVLPDPSQTFSGNDSVHIYYEVYNLGRDPRGINNYDQEITVNRKDDEGRSVFGEVVSGVVKFFGSKDEALKRVSGTKLISHSKNHQMVFRTNFGTLEKGEYVLHVKLKDNVTGQSAQTETEFIIK